MRRGLLMANLCTGCDCPEDRCINYGPGRKCCPDCRHPKPCQCWRFVNVHEGHCCFSAGTVDDYPPGGPIPCGHEVTDA